MTTPRDDIAGLIERLPKCASVEEVVSEVSGTIYALSARVKELEEQVFELQHGVDAEYRNGLRTEAEARVKELEAERDEARKAANLGCDARNGGAHSIMVEGSYKFCTGCGETIRTPTLQERARAAEARATRLQQELADEEDRGDQATRRMTDLSNQVSRLQQELDAMNDNHRVMARQMADLGRALIKAEQDRDEAIAALKPFVDVAEEMLSRGWDASNVALALDNPNEPHRVTAGDFFAIRRLAGPEKEGK